MKRFTDTAKWSDHWYRKLSGTAKLLWIYLIDNCNPIGLIELDFSITSIDFGQKVEEKHLTELGDRVQHLGHGRLFIPKFINFQYGELSTACAPHRKILKLVADHNLIKVGIHYHYPTISLSEKLSTHEDQEEEEEEDKDQEEERKRKRTDIYHPESRTVLLHVNQKTGRNFRETDTNLGFISARLSEVGVTLQGVIQMIDRQCSRWMGGEYEEYLRPETLFNKTKFDNYYAAKDVPVNGAPKAALGIPVWKQIEIIQEEIDTHPANPDFRGFNRDTVTPDQREHLKLKRQKLVDLKAHQSSLI